jgi:hypothetical protein
MVLSVEETLMYFGYTYAPNLTHQGASVITEISSATSMQMVTGIQHLQTPISSPAAPKMHFQKAKTIQLVKKLTCAKTLKEARARVQAKEAKRAHMRHMRDCVRENPCTPVNDAFMVLVGPSPTSGPAPNLI